jgi:hypothetical protein
LAHDLVYVDGKLVGPTGPKAHEVGPGEHEVRVEKEGWRTFIKRVVLDAGDEKIVRAHLAPV